MNQTSNPVSPYTYASTETFDGSSWSEVNDLIAAGRGIGGSGTSNATIAFGGQGGLGGDVKNTVLSAGTVTAKRGGAVKSVKPTKKTKTQSKSLKEIITSAFETSKKKEENNRSEEIEKNKEKQAEVRKTVQEKQKTVKGFSGGYGF